MINVPSTSTRNVVIAGGICAIVLLGVGIVLDRQGVRLGSSLAVMLTTSSIMLAVIMLVRQRSRGR